MSLAGALEGIRVLDLTRLLPGPYLSMALADLGADVIKIEAPGMGDYLRHMPPLHGRMSGRFLAINRGKRSVALDLKTAVGHAAFLRLCAGADVVIESFRPGVMAKLGLGWEILERQNSRLVMCSITGYGQTGPYASRAGHDLNYVGTAGVLAMTGERDATPIVPGIQIADLAGGALWGLSGILAALVARERGGGGAHLDISMTEGAMALLAPELGNLQCPGSPSPSRGAGDLNGGLARYRVYRTKDGGYISVAPLEPKFWQPFNQIIGRQASGSELFAPEAEQERIAEEIAERIASKTRAQWADLFDGVECCADIVLDITELETHPQHVDRDVFFELATSDGPITQMRLPIGDGRRACSPPAHGEHTAEVLAEFGFTENEISEISS